MFLRGLDSYGVFKVKLIFFWRIVLWKYIRKYLNFWGKIFRILKMIKISKKCYDCVRFKEFFDR